jgi:heme/copper-type cytochrome/quinol oxidase subunit 3
VKEDTVLDLTELPEHGLGTASPSWWGTLAFMLIEGTGFALSIVIYLYLMSLAPRWPLNAAAPDLLAGTTLTAVLLQASFQMPSSLAGRVTKICERFASD